MTDVGPVELVESLELVEVTPENWRDVVKVTPREGQEQFVAPVSYYLCLCHYGDVWKPFAVRLGDAIV
jgi:diamine N-acetyltransferase